MVFDNVLGTSNSNYIDQFLIGSGHNNLVILFQSQSYFDLPKGTIRNNSIIIILFTQTLKDIENIYRHVGGYDMSCDEFKEFCRKSWEDEYNFLCIDRSKKKDQRKYCFCNESQNKYLDCTPETRPF